MNDGLLTGWKTSRIPIITTRSLDVREWERLGYSTIHKFGFNPDVDTGTTPEDVWDIGGVYTGFVAAAAATEIVSSVAADAAAGTGAQQVKVYGLDTNLNEISETVILTGVVPVVLANQYKRVYRAHTVVVGSGGVNAGDIDIRHTVGPVNLARISVGRGQTLMAIYTIPASYKEARLIGISASVGRDLSTTAELELRTSYQSEGLRVRDIAEPHSQGGVTGTERLVDLILRPTEDVWIRVASVTTNNTGIGATFDILLIP